MPHERPQRSKQRRCTALEPSWRAYAEERAHEQAEIQRRGVHHQAFANIVVPPQMDAPHPSGFIKVGTRTFHSLAALAQQPFPSCAPNPSPVAVHRITGLGVVFPLPTAAIRFGDVAPDADRFEVHHHLILFFRRPARSHRLEWLPREPSTFSW